MPIDLQRLLFAGWFCCLFFFSRGAAAESDPAENRGSNPTFSMHADMAQSARSRVKVLMNVEGKLRIRSHQKKAKEPAENEKKNGDYEPRIKVSAKMYYDEQVLSVGGTTGLPATSMRYYYMAEANLDVDQKSVETKLGAERRYILHECSETPVFSSPLGPLTRSELDLISVPCNTTYCAVLLPNEPLKAGDTWDQSGDRLALFLGLDDVGQCQVKTRLESVENGQAMLSMEGDLTGVVDGVTTDIELVAEYRFDMANQHITWLTMDVKENRSISQARAGFDVVARIQMRSAVIEDSEPLQSNYLQAIATDPTEVSSHLRFDAESAGFHLLHDRRWFGILQEDKSNVIRMVDDGKLIAQCNITRLPDLKDKSPPRMDAFQKDIRKALGDNFGELIVAEDYKMKSGLQAMRIVAGGRVDELPIRWIYYHLTSPEGRRLVCVFTLESGLEEEFAESDRSLIQSLQFSAELDSGAEPTPVAEPDRTAAAPAQSKEETTITQ